MLTKSMMFRVFVSPMALLLLLGAAYSAYKGHADDRDVNSVLAVYPDLKDTAVDSCATCHKSGIISDPEQPRGTRDYEWERAREEFVAGEKVVIFGALKSAGNR